MRDFQSVIGARRGSRSSNGPGAFPTPWWPVSAVAPTPSGSSTRSWPTNRWVCMGFEAGGDGGRHRKACGHPHRGQPGCCTAPGLTCCRTTRVRRSSRIPSAPGLTTPGGSGARMVARHRQGRVRTDHRRRGDVCLRTAVSHRGDHPGHRVPTRWPARCDLSDSLGPEGVILVNLSGRGDKDVATAARGSGWRRRAR